MSGVTQEPRTAVMILVEASWLDSTGTLRSLQARMENHSAHGACIRMKARVAVGKRVYIQSHREQSGQKRGKRAEKERTHPFIPRRRRDGAEFSEERVGHPGRVGGFTSA